MTYNSIQSYYTDHEMCIDSGCFVVNIGACLLQTSILVVTDGYRAYIDGDCDNLHNYDFLPVEETWQVLKHSRSHGKDCYHNRSEYRYCSLQ